MTDLNDVFARHQGRSYQAQRGRKPRLSITQVEDVINRLFNGESQRSIASLYEVSPTTINSIAKRLQEAD
ncbi:hypothetical protein EM59_016510 [Vibrio parahaemolyticus]|uniref:hypothetical protein n=1 Tax=Vibrio parahaemolyticus TaxID=670 RepID=UPI0009EF9C5C|nr:hypothetical protein [Vibrio parahaemolyticus]EGQ7650931.1 hypothetical protein [Vibrio parahaemolyticus]EGQ9979483.1 hypothetical protein [Vibrio parahaemolyticus]EJG1824813.1 hypothetical protein [Vibrio parahaemolyticus]ELB2744122.1 hypothetical protein [Vibrio parahaemolyticus]ELC9528621.1 hypothetical protein [Vibrio parahaemolyticus]